MSRRIALSSGKRGTSLSDLVETAERHEELRLREVRPSGRERRRCGDVADVDLRHLEHIRLVAAEVDRQEPVRLLPRELGDEAHRLLADGARLLVVDEAAAVDVPGDPRGGEVATEVLEPLVTGRLQELVRRGKGASPRRSGPGRCSATM